MGTRFAIGRDYRRNGFVLGSWFLVLGSKIYLPNVLLDPHDGAGRDGGPSRHRSGGALHLPPPVVADARRPGDDERVPQQRPPLFPDALRRRAEDRSEEHTSELQSPYAI